MDKLRKINWPKLIGRILMIAAFYYIVRRFMSFDVDWSVLLRPNILTLALLPILSSIIFIYISAYMWKRILGFFAGKKISFSSIYPVYIKSNIAKYLPGGIMNYVSRNIMCVDLGLSQIQIAVSSFVEIAVTLFSNFIFVFLFARKSFFEVMQKYINFSNDQIIIFFIIIVVLFSLLILFLVIYKKINITYFMKTYFNYRFLGLFLFNSFICIVTTIIGLLLFLLVLNAISPISFTQSLAIVGANQLSFVIGFITPGVPGGIGVREAVFTFLLQDLCGVDLLLLFAALQRIIAVLADVIAYLIQLAIERLKRRSQGIKEIGNG